MKTLVLKQKNFSALRDCFDHYYLAFYTMTCQSMSKDAIKALINRNHLDINRLLLY